jgi:hypothetical protein
MEERYMEILAEPVDINQNTIPIYSVASSTLKYGYVTVEYQTEEVLFDDVWRYLGYEQIGPRDKIVVEFEKDDFDPNNLSVYDVELVHCDDMSICDPLYTTHINMPQYFYHKGDILKFYNYKTPTITEYFWKTKRTLKLNQFDSYSGIKNIKKLPSVYNCIYTYKYNTDVFAMTKIKESDKRCNFLIAYNPALITEEHAVFMLKHILRPVPES